MIDLQTTTLKGGASEVKFSSQLEKEDIPYKFGRLKANGESHEAIFIIKNYAVSFDKFSTAIETALRNNKFIPQIWHPSELTWGDLSLDRRLPLHP